MNSKVFQFVSNKVVVLSMLLTIVTLSLWSELLPYFIGISFVLTIMWSSNWLLKEFGIRPFNCWHTILSAFAYAFMLYVTLEFIITPLLEVWFGEINYNKLQALRGNPQATISFLLFLWVLVVIEEFLFRGYGLNFLAKSRSNQRLAWISAAILSSVLFGLTHQNQGISAVILTSILGLALAFLFIQNKKNLVLPILVHGIYDTFKIILIYLDSERVVSDLFINA